jgi:hypothetical protein
MPVHFEIREDGRVAYYRITDPWTTQNLIAHYPADNAHRASVTHIVHTLMDVTGMRQVPINILLARNNAPAFSHPNNGVLILTGARPMAKSFAELIFKMASFQRGRFLATADDGWAFIHSLMANEDRIRRGQEAAAHS